MTQRRSAGKRLSPGIGALRACKWVWQFARGGLLVAVCGSPAYGQNLAPGEQGAASVRSVSPSSLRAVEERADASAAKPEAEGYVAHEAALDQVLEALAATLGKPVVPSAKARRKKVSGDFDLAHPRVVLDRLCADLGLVSYFDGHVIYVYDAAELTNAIGSLRSIDVRSLIVFLRKSGLYSEQFPINGDADSQTFYVAGPPVYVDAVLAAAKHLDRGRIESRPGEDVVKVISLRHTFVRDRIFKLRDQTIQVPGIATVLSDMIGARADPAHMMPPGREEGGAATRDAASPNAWNTWNALPGVGEPVRSLSVAGGYPPYSPSHAGEPGAAYASGNAASLPPIPRAEHSLSSDRPDFTGFAGQAIRIGTQPAVLAFPDTNSLLIKGAPAEVDYLSKLVEQLDVEKTQIELSLWIIDLSHRSLEQLGVRWQAGFRAGGVGATFNLAGAADGLSGALSTLDGARFLASVFAMSKQGHAQVVSRPLILTQENVPAIFDNNRTFYAKLVGERATSLDRITYGTLVSVIPRLSADHGEIEMILDIEDGDTASTSGGDLEVDGLPVVGRTHINTIARVPRELSLLIGGYTRHAEDSEQFKVPLLGDIPVIGTLFRYREATRDDVVRVFLIQPRLLPRRAVWDGEGFREIPRLTPDMSVTQGTTLLDEAARRGVVEEISP